MESSPYISEHTSETVTGALPSEGADTTSTPKNKHRSKKTKDKANNPPKKAQRKPLEPSKTEHYLQALQAQGLEPSLHDLERLKPKRQPHPETSEYADAYHKLVDAMCRSFSSDQLRKFTIQYDLPSKYTHLKRRKVQYAEAIIEQQWEWPCLKELERKQRDRTEIISQSFPLSQSHLFLLIGSDGSDLLQLSMRYNVHISLTQNPLALQVEGLRESLNGVQKHIKDLETMIIEETFQVPTRQPIRRDLVQRISRIAGAFVENLGTEGKIRVLAKEPKSLNGAKRLSMQAASELMNANPLLSYSPANVTEQTPLPILSAPITYALYPFLSPRSLPWLINTSGAFRWRRVGDWLGFDHSENIDVTGGLAGAKGSYITVHEKSVNLKKVLLDGLPPEPQANGQCKRLIKAYPGHLLFTSPSMGQRATLIPPLSGSWPYERLLKWVLDRKSRPSFIPSLPSPFLKTPPSEQKLTHRLIYRALPPADFAVTAKSRKVLHFELTLPQPKPVSHISDGPIDESVEGILDLSDSLECWKGLQTDVDVLMPDRQMDIRFSAMDTVTLVPGEEPSELQTYANELETFLNPFGPEMFQPNPPLALNYEGEEYVLSESVSVRQSKESVLSSPLDPSSSTIHAVTESLLDLESSQKFTVCLLSCDDYTLEESWSAFLRDCDTLTVAPAQKEAPLIDARNPGLL
ncbi:hypothetical protein EW146_g5258 [Bondarzewia mesenterica]|uniref:Uncharacterized protein n=1 Tax=Bondarzewia mesenterica TaxID=1095465 RepID=A0A4S4LS42_9AGAM|nr:hypothetical protein EW146_g5258 [Bondarzewia mesenterica]